MRFLVTISALLISASIFAQQSGAGTNPRESLQPSQADSLTKPKMFFRCGTTNFPKGPLYIVDGKISDSLTVSKITPTQIASMEVLKGAPATALYGSRGIHGVVLLKTKTTQVIVDGIIRDHGYLTKMDPNLIESIDILKDSTASYLHCSRGNYGVIMVTTKRPRIQVTVDSSGRQLHTFRYGSLSDSSLYPYLVILNGIPIENEKLSTLTAGNIQSVDILHESVTARISCRALGGVVVITTKCRYTDELPVF